MDINKEKMAEQAKQVVSKTNQSRVTIRNERDEEVMSMPLSTCILMSALSVFTAFSMGACVKKKFHNCKEN